MVCVVLRMNAFHYVRSIAATILVSSLALPALAGATTIDYSTVGPFSGTTFTTNGLTATAQNAGTLSIKSGIGLGVVGGGLPPDIDAIDGNESVLFSFQSGAATDVAFGGSSGFSNSASNFFLNLEGFDIHGTSLGIQTFNFLDAISFATPIDVSAAFGDVPLSAFTIAGNGQSVGIELLKVTFTDAATPPAVPEPATLLLCGSGLAFIGARLRRPRGNS